MVVRTPKRIILSLAAALALLLLYFFAYADTTGQHRTAVETVAEVISVGAIIVIAALFVYGFTEQGPKP